MSEQEITALHTRLQDYVQIEQLIGDKQAITAAINMLHLFEEACSLPRTMELEPA